MSTAREQDAMVAEIRGGLDHPIVDADAHHIEPIPVILEYLSDVAGPTMADRFMAELASARRAFRMSLDERRAERVGIPVWWPMPTERHQLHPDQTMRAFENGSRAVDLSHLAGDGCRK